jgi:hypothetical protein
MLNGYNNKIVRVNLTTLKIDFESSASLADVRLLDR